MIKNTDTQRNTKRGEVQYGRVEKGPELNFSHVQQNIYIRIEQFFLKTN